MRTIEQEIEDLRHDAARALAEHPSKTPLDPSVTFAQAVTEWYRHLDAVAGHMLDENIQFRTGQHVARLNMCAVLEAIGQLPVSGEQRLAAFLRFHARTVAIHQAAAKELGYDIEERI